ncbi:preprotein translocase subunit SecA [Myxococcota bacterium]|nr:preprotein translocase subunit SecA [Myxococcota bacterium]
MMNLITRFFGTANERALAKVTPYVPQINALEAQMKKLSDAELKAKTPYFKEKLERGASLDDILVESFAVCREASVRVLGLRPYDVQLIGGAVLHGGKIAEMKTGEGKTLVATLPCYLNALSGKGVHVVTVNDYLARRDAEWMGQLYKWLGLSVGVVVHGLRDEERQANYRCDIAYGQNNEFGFDYLRDNMKFDLTKYVQRELNFAIVDEVDSILIDEARTPLIISGPAEDSSELYVTVDKIIPRIKRDVHYNVDEKSWSATLTEDGVETIEGMLKVENLYAPENIILLHHVNNALKAHTLYRRDVNYLVKDGEVVIIDEHTGRLMPGRRWSDGLHQAVEAKEGVAIQAENHTLATISFQNYFRLYNKLAGMTGTAKTEEEEFQKIYKLDCVQVPTHKPTVRTDKPDIVYRTEKGKFRAIVEEIKECHGKGQPVLVGTISVEKSEILHRMLDKENIPHSVLNAKHHAREASIVAQAGRYGAVTVATNMAGRGTDILLGGNAEFAGQSLLEELGFVRHTEEWERVEHFVKQICIKKEDLAREMLPEFDGRVPEELIGRIATIRDELRAEHDKVVAAGGLHIIGTERHESRRIDNQLRGRAGRQGDPGSSRFYLSLDDDLMRIFGSDRLTAIMDRLGMTDEAPIEAAMVTRSIEGAQKRVEGQHFDSRKNLLEYDDVMNQQRKTIYAWRRRILSADEAGLREVTLDAIEDLVINLTTIHCPPNIQPHEWKLDQLAEDAEFQFGLRPSFEGLPTNPERYQEAIYFKVEEAVKAREAGVNKAQPDLFARVERDLFLRTIDELWRNHLQTMDQLRQGIGLRGYGQRDPKKEYQKEGYRLFQDALMAVKSQVVGQLLRVQVRSEAEVAQQEAEYRRRVEAMQQQMQMKAQGGGEKSEDGAPQGPSPEEILAQRRRLAVGAAASQRRSRAKIGRNDPCWCGSGKKYKKCHMEADGGGEGDDGDDEPGAGGAKAPEATA